MTTTWPTSLNPAALRALREALPAGALLLDSAERIAYSVDNSKRQALPLAVALPDTAEQVAALVTACAEHGLPLTARGRGTNTTGASVPVAGGVALSFERMRRIVDINTADRYAVVEPGVLNGDLQAALAPHGFFWPKGLMPPTW